MPSVRDNTQFECTHCHTIVDFAGDTPLGNLRPCPNCGQMKWDQLRITSVCDFCATTQNVSWEFPCEDFRLPVAPGLPDQGFKGAWGACDECKVLVEARDIRGLLARAILMDPDKDNRLAHVTVIAAHTAFFAHRTGDPVAFREKED